MTEYGRIHIDGSRSGGQPTQSDANERLGAWLSAALDDPNCSDAFKQDINDWFASQPTQSDADMLADKSDDYAIGSLSVLLERELYENGHTIGEGLAEKLAEIAVQTVRHPTQSDALREELATRFYRKSGEFQVGLTVPEATILAAEAFAFLQEK